MIKRILAIVTAAAVALSITLVPAGAQEEPPPEVPEVVQIEDPEGDANYLGDDQTTPQDLSVSDLLRVWFTNDAETISVHIQTEAPPPSSNASYFYRVSTNPGDNELGCLQWEALVDGPTYASDPFGRLDDDCDDADPFDGELTIATGPEDTGIITITVPRSSHSALADGMALTSPWAEVRNATGPIPEQSPVMPGSFLIFPTVDDTQVGDDYTIQAEKKKKKKKKKKKRRGGGRSEIVVRPAGGRMIPM